MNKLACKASKDVDAKFDELLLPKILRPICIVNTTLKYINPQLNPTGEVNLLREVIRI